MVKFKANIKFRFYFEIRYRKGTLGIGSTLKMKDER